MVDSSFVYICVCVCSHVCGGCLQLWRPAESREECSLSSCALGIWSWALPELGVGIFRWLTSTRHLPACGLLSAVITGCANHPHLIMRDLNSGPQGLQCIINILTHCPSPHHLCLLTPPLKTLLLCNLCILLFSHLRGNNTIYYASWSWIIRPSRPPIHIPPSTPSFQWNCFGKNIW